MKDQNIIVRIPEPCNEDWNKMIPDNSGKFCSSCSKSVFDFSNKSDQQIRDILIQNQHNKICGHFKKTQIDRPLQLNISLNHLPKYVGSARTFAIAVFLVFGTFLFSCTDNNGKPINNIKMVNAEETYVGGMIMAPDELPKFSPDSMLKGDVVSEEEFVEGEIIPYIEPTMVGGLSYVVEETPDCVINEKDEEPIEYLPPTDTLADLSLPELNIRLSLKLFNNENEPIGETIDSVSIKKDNDKLLSITQSLLVYPNPGSGEFTVNYEILRKSHVCMDIFDLQGAWIKTLVNGSQHTGKYQLPLNLNGLANGCYMLQMVNEGKRFSEKIILQH